MEMLGKIVAPQDLPQSQYVVIVKFSENKITPTWYRNQQRVTKSQNMMLNRKYIYYILELPFRWVVRTIERIWCKAILQLSPFKLNKNPAETEKVVQTFILLEVVMQWIVQQLHQLHPAQVTLECQKLQLPCMQT
jgi:hypothetical protein